MTGVEVAAYAGLAAAAVAAGGAAASAQASSNQAKFKSKEAELQAAHDLAQARIDAKKFSEDEKRKLSRARALRANSGVLTSTGTPLLTDEDLVREIAFNTERLRQGGELRAGSLRNQANLYRSAAGSAQVTGGLRAGSSLLGGYSDFAN